MNELIPNRLLFNFAFPLRHRAEPPLIDGSLTGWTDHELLPKLSQLEDRDPHANVWCCWNDSGLYIATEVKNKKKTLRCDPKLFWKSDNLRLCTDMRDARRNKRATRYCQQFFFLPTGGGEKKNEPIAGSAKIHRAREDAPLYSSSTKAHDSSETKAHGLYPVGSAVHLQVASQVSETGYTLEARIPAACLVGFDPAQHRRIGFYYMLEDRDHPQQFLTAGDEFNWHIDPSTWATAILDR